MYNIKYIMCNIKYIIKKCDTDPGTKDKDLSPASDGH